MFVVIYLMTCFEKKTHPDDAIQHSDPISEIHEDVIQVRPLVHVNIFQGLCSNLEM